MDVFYNFTIPAAHILTASAVDFVNKSGTSEMFAGLEMQKYYDCFLKAELYYWQNLTKGSNAEIDYLRTRDGIVLPVEVKANTKGSMQSLWIFMRKRKLNRAIRPSLENFGQFDHYDPEDNITKRHVDIVPLYALSNLNM